MVEFNNIKDLQKYLTEKTKIFSDPKRAKEIKDGIVHIIRDDVSDRFRNFQFTNTGGYVLGNKEWKPVSSEYLLEHPKRQNMPMLEDTGTLKNSIVNEGAMGSYIEYTDKGVSLGTKIPYAKIQNEQRPFLFWHEDLKQKVVEYVKSEMVL